MRDAAKPPLHGLRVVEVGELIAGPFVGTLLSEFGAEVIKVERPGSGDILRRFGPRVNGTSLYWITNSRNKKSVVLDLRRVGGRTVLLDLIRESDVLVQSMRPGTFEAWGLEEERLRAVNPRLVTVSVSAFGRRGPLSGKGGYDPIAQGFSGLSFITGEPDRPPVRAGGSVPVCDFMSGAIAALGAVLALYERDARGSGLGQLVDVALYDLAFRMIAPLLSLYDLTGEVWQRQGNHSLSGAPTGHFQAADGKWVCISVQSDDQFARCARLVGRADWLEDPRFSTLEARTRHRDVINDAVARWTSSRTQQAVIRALDDAGLVIGPVQSVAELATDPHLATRSVETYEAPGLGRFRVPTVVPILSRTPGAADRPAPRLGGDTEEVLSRVLGYSDEKVRRLRDAEIIAVGRAAAASHGKEGSA